MQTEKSFPLIFSICSKKKYKNLKNEENPDLTKMCKI